MGVISPLKVPLPEHMTPFEQKLYRVLVETMGQPAAYRYMKSTPASLAKLSQSLSVVMIAYALAAKDGSQIKSDSLIGTNRNTVRKYLRYHRDRLPVR